MKTNELDSCFVQPKEAFETIKRDWKAWVKTSKIKKYVVGISGGVDSSCAAALAVKIFGKENVVGVSLPCNGQSDISDVDKVFKHLKIKRITIDIGDMFFAGLQSIENNAIEITDICRTNMPARIRMTMLYGIAQCINGIVINTSQRSEAILGNDTLFGDSCGSYSPFKALTKTEVKMLAKWLNIPLELVNKTPIDGLQPLTDEQRLGITYDTVDAYLRYAKEISYKEEKIILDKFMKNKFKLEMINIAGPKFLNYKDRIRDIFNL